MGRHAIQTQTHVHPQPKPALRLQSPRCYYADCSCRHSINPVRSSCLTSTTDVSNMSCFAPAPLSSAACWNARPNLLPSAPGTPIPTYFFRTSPNSGAPVTPTTRYDPLSSFRHATTNGSALPDRPDRASLSAHLSRVASTSHRASLDSVEGCAKSRRSGPSLSAQKRNVRKGRIVFFSSKEAPCRIIDRCNVMARGRDLRSKPTLLLACASMMRMGPYSSNAS